MTQFDGYFCHGFNDLLVIHGERINYLPSGLKSDPVRYMAAIVNRNPSEILVEGEIMLPSMTIDVQNDSTVVRAGEPETTGISSTEVTKRDQVEVAVKSKGPLIRKAVFMVENEDAQVVTLVIA